MFCKECGTENQDGSMFCEKCGASLTGEGKKEKIYEIDKTTVKYNIKPKYNWGYKILTVGLPSILVILFIVFYIFEDLTLVVMSAFLPIVIGIIAIYTLGRLIIEKLQYDRLDYDFYADRVEYKDGFLNVTEKELKYKFVRETTMSQNILERIFKIGTIRIFTNASSGYTGGYGNNRNAQMYNGIIIHCVENVKEQYEAVKKIIDEGVED